jgi:hypothetical protein
MNVMDAGTGKVPLSQVTRNNFALVGEAYLSCFAQIWCDPSSLRPGQRRRQPSDPNRHVETLIRPQEDRASRSEYMAGAVKAIDGIMETALPRNGQDGLPISGL